MKPVLLLVDLQNDFLRAGQLEPHPDGVLAAAGELLENCRRAGVPVIHIWSTVKAGCDNRMPHWKVQGRFQCLEGSTGHNCPESVHPTKSETIIHKTFFSGFSSHQLRPILNQLGADLLIIAGVHVHACVRATALDAYANNFRVIVVEDATASNDPVHAEISRRYLADRSIVFRTARAISQALGDSGSGAMESLLEKDRILCTHSSPQNVACRWTVRAAQKEDVETAAATARESFEEWRSVAVQERLAFLKKWGEALGTAQNELIALLVQDVGKPIRYARGEVARAIALIDAAANQIDPGQDRIQKKTGYRREPHGVIGLIGPFNNPLAIPIGKIVPALLYGNAVLWKPAIPGSRIARKAVQLFEGATARTGLMQVLCGAEETARQVMVASDAVTISGSLKAGRSAQEICATRHLPLQAELGGNNASIVWVDADLDLAARSIAEGAFAFAGQRCTANRRAIVEASIYDAFLEKLMAASGALIWGDPANEQTHIGPVITKESRDRISALMTRAGKLSSRVCRPFPNSSAQQGDAWIEPIIVCCDEPNAEIVQEETFGPVLVVQRATTWDHAVSLCNGVKQGLAAAVFSTSADLIQSFFRRARAGILKVNCSTADAAVDLPFGGWKASGVGPPEHGPANREFFTRMQAIYFG